VAGLGVDPGVFSIISKILQLIQIHMAERLSPSDYLLRNDWLSSLIGALLCRLGCGRDAP